MIDNRRLTEHFHKEMDSLQVRQLVVVRVNADAKKETCVSPVHDFVIPKIINMSGDKGTKDLDKV
jgi:hypothetical protein